MSIKKSIIRFYGRSVRFSCFDRLVLVAAVEIMLKVNQKQERLAKFTINIGPNTHLTQEAIQITMLD